MGGHRERAQAGLLGRGQGQVTREGPLAITCIHRKEFRCSVPVARVSVTVIVTVEFIDRTTRARLRPKALSHIREGASPPRGCDRFDAKDSYVTCLCRGLEHTFQSPRGREQ